MFHVPPDAEALTVTPVLRPRADVPARAYVLTVRPAPGHDPARELGDGAYAWSEGLSAAYRYLPSLTGGETRLLRSFVVPPGWDRLEVGLTPWGGTRTPAAEAFEPLALVGELPLGGGSAATAPVWLLDRTEA